MDLDDEILSLSAAAHAVATSAVLMLVELGYREELQQVEKRAIRFMEKSLSAAKLVNPLEAGELSQATIAWIIAQASGQLPFGQEPQ